MRRRWLRIGILAGVLFAINLVGRLVVRIGSLDDPDTQDLVTLVAYGGIGLVMLGSAIWWGRLRPLGVVVADLAQPTSRTMLAQHRLRGRPGGRPGTSSVAAARNLDWKVITTCASSAKRCWGCWPCSP